MVGLACVGVRQSRYVSDQISYMVSGGLGGLVLLGAGAVLIVTAGLADEWRKLDRVAAFLPGPRSGPGGETLVRRARLVGGAGLATAAVFVVSAWSRVSNQSDPVQGFEAMGLGALGLLIGFGLCGASTLWLHRRVARRKAVLFAPWDARPAAAGAAPAAPDRLVVAAGLLRYHRAGCPAVQSMEAREIDRRQLPPGLAPCELCEAN